MFSTKKGNLYTLFFILHFITGSYVVAYLLDTFKFLSGTVIMIGLSQLLLVFLPVLYYYFFFKTPIKETFRFNKLKPLNILLSVFLAISSIPIVMLINVLSQFFVKQALGDTLKEITNENYWLSLLVIAVFPAVFEELIARGIIVSHYRHKKVLITSAMSGFFFGMMHLNINQFLYAFFLGFLFSIVVHITGSIFSSMIMHFVINGVNLSLAFLAASPALKELVESQEAQALTQGLSQSELLLQSLPFIIFLALVSLPFIALILFVLISYNDKLQLIKSNAPSYMFFDQSNPIMLNTDMLINEDTKYKQPVITLSLIFTFIIFLAVSIISEFF